jgi:hypothetical protein
MDVKLLGKELTSYIKCVVEQGSADIWNRSSVSLA